MHACASSLIHSTIIILLCQKRLTYGSFNPSTQPPLSLRDHVAPSIHHRRELQRAWRQHAVMPSSASATPPLKRPRLSPEAYAENPTTILQKRKLPPIVRQRVQDESADVLSDEVVNAMMEQSMGLLLQSHGYNGSSGMALEYIREMAENCKSQKIRTGCMEYAMADECCVFFPSLSRHAISNATNYALRALSTKV